MLRWMTLHGPLRVASVSIAILAASLTAQQQQATRSAKTSAHSRSATSNAPSLSGTPTTQSAQTTLPCTAPATTQKAPTPLDEAQRAYYNESTRRLQHPWFDRIFSGGAAFFAAFLAATVAFVTFRKNYRATLQSQRDTQFYEALKRCGAVSANVRSSAAVLLGQLASTKDFQWAWQQSFPWLRREAHLPYFETTLEQMVAATLLESDDVVLAGIRGTFQRLVQLDPQPTYLALVGQNKSLGQQLYSALGNFFASTGASKPEDVSASTWAAASAATGYRESVLQFHRKALDPDASPNEWPWRALERAHTRMQARSEDQRDKIAKDARRKLTVIGAKLQGHVEVWGKALQFGNPSSSQSPTVLPKYLFLVGLKLSSAKLNRLKLIDGLLQDSSLDLQCKCHDASLISSEFDHAYVSAEFDRSNLAHCSFAGAHVSFSSFENATLRFVNFRGAQLKFLNLRNAKVWGAKTDDATTLEPIEWLCADFLPEPDDHPSFGGEDTKRLLARVIEPVRQMLEEIKKTELEWSERKEEHARITKEIQGGSKTLNKELEACQNRLEDLRRHLSIRHNDKNKIISTLDQAPPSMSDQWKPLRDLIDANFTL
jgi:Pentapeptide repeats (8 copies)